MPQTTQTQQEISALNSRMANVEQMVRFGLAASDEAKAHARKHFKEMKNSARLYLELKEPKTQEKLQTAIRLSLAQVSRLCTHLEEQGFIKRGKNPANAREWMFRWTEVERIVGLSKIARDCVRDSEK